MSDDLFREFGNPRRRKDDLGGVWRWIGRNFWAIFMAGVYVVTMSTKAGGWLESSAHSDADIMKKLIELERAETEHSQNVSSTYVRRDVFDATLRRIDDKLAQVESYILRQGR